MGPEALDDDREIQPLDQLLDHDHRIFRLVQVGEEDRELIAAEPRHRVRAPGRRPDLRGHMP